MIESHSTKRRRALSACAASALLVFVQGCTGDKPVVQPTNPNDIGGVHMSAEDQIKAVESDSRLTPQEKERKLAVIKGRIDGGSAESGPPGAMRRR